MIETSYPLSESRTGESAVLHAAHLDFDDRQLLAAMGLVDRCQLRICQQGSPCIVEVGGTRMALDRSLADSILVWPARA